MSIEKYMNVNKKFSFYLFVAIMASIMSFFMSLIFTFLAIGFTPNFLSIWFESFIIGCIVAFPIALLADPIARKIVKQIFK